MVFVFDIFLQGMAECGALADGKDFVGELFDVPKIISKGGPDHLGNAGLLGKDEGVAVVCCFKCSEAKWLRDGAHDEDIRYSIDVAELFTTDKAGKKDASRDAEPRGLGNEAVSFLAVASKDKEELGVFLDGKCRCVHKM